MCIAFSLSFDILPSSNAGYFILDSSCVSSPNGVPGAAGSALIEETFAHYHRHRGIPIKSVAVHSCSDPWPFFEAGLAVGGVETSGFEPKLRKW